jgi:hypothetical protein
MKHILAFTLFALLISTPLSAALPEPDDKELHAHMVLMFGHAEVLKLSHTMLARHRLTLTSITPRYESETEAIYAFAYREHPEGGLEAHFEVVVKRAQPATASQVLKVKPPSGASE